MNTRDLQVFNLLVRYKNTSKNVLVLSDTAENAITLVKKNKEFENCDVISCDTLEYDGILCDKIGKEFIDFSNWSFFNLFIDNEIYKEFKYENFINVKNKTNTEVLRYDKFIQNLSKTIEKQLITYCQEKIEEPVINSKRVFYFKTDNGKCIIKIVNVELKDNLNLEENIYYKIDEIIFANVCSKETYESFRQSLLSYCENNEEKYEFKEINPVDAFSHDNSCLDIWTPLYVYYLFGEKNTGKLENIIEQDAKNQQHEDLSPIIEGILGIREQMFDNKGKLKIPEKIKHLYSDQDCLEKQKNKTDEKKPALKDMALNCLLDNLNNNMRQIKKFNQEISEKEIVEKNIKNSEEKSDVLLSSELSRITDFEKNINTDISMKESCENVNSAMMNFANSYETMKANGEFSNLDETTQKQLDIIISNITKEKTKCQ